MSQPTLSPLAAKIILLDFSLGITTRLLTSQNFSDEASEKLTLLLEKATEVLEVPSDHSLEKVVEAAVEALEFLIPIAEDKQP